MFMYTIDAPDYSNKPDKIRPKFNFEYKMELLDNKPEDKIDQWKTTKMLWFLRLFVLDVLFL